MTEPQPPLNNHQSIEKHMETYARSLLARPAFQAITLFKHQIKTDVAFRMFYNILRPLLQPSGHPKPDLDTAQSQDEAAASLAFDALWATCLKLHKRGGENSRSIYGPDLRQKYHSHTALPTQDFGKFPAYVTALINDFGSVRGRYGSMHMPYMLYHEVEALRPPTYNPNHRVKFLASVQTGHFGRLDTIAPTDQKDFSAWWTLHAYEHEDSPANFFSIWSPVPAEDVKPHLKLAAAFAEDRLTTTAGLAHFTTTPFYDVPIVPEPDHYTKPAYLAPNPKCCLPVQVWHYPYFDQSAVAFQSVVEEKDVDSEDLRVAGLFVSRREPGGMHAANVLDKDWGSTVVIAEKGQRSDGEGKAAASERGGKKFRMVHHYYDHCVVSDVSVVAR